MGRRPFFIFCLPLFSNPNWFRFVQKWRVIRVPTSRRLTRAFLALLVLTCFVGLQGVSATHEHQGPDNHCAVCNASHLPVSQAIAVAHLTPPAVLTWQRLHDAERQLLERVSNPAASRGPPAFSFSV